MIGTLHGIALDCPDPDSPAAFYAELLGMVRVQDEADWVVIGDTFRVFADPVGHPFCLIQT
jgi:catechol 2,3-dioxygenase-like lactoylglutathione lyase family enzyme